MRHDFAKLRRLPPYVLAEVTQLKHAARKAGEDIIDLGMGNPDLPTPPHVVEKICRGGAGTRGTTATRCRAASTSCGSAICDWYQRRYDVELDPESEAIVTIGSKEGLGAPRARDARSRRRRALLRTRPIRSTSTR